MPSSERQIGLPQLEGEDANARARHETKAQGPIDGLNQAVIRFEEVKDFTTFRAKFTWMGSDLILQFFITEEDDKPALVNGMVNSPGLKNYWLNTFPTALDRVAKDHFRATKPRIEAKYTEELASWWFKAQGYADRIDPDAFVHKFLELLDQALEPSETQPDS